MTNVDKILEWAIVGRRVDVVHKSHDVTCLCVKFLVKKTIKKAVNLIHCFKSGSGKPLIQTRKLTVS